MWNATVAMTYDAIGAPRRRADGVGVTVSRTGARGSRHSPLLPSRRRIDDVLAGCKDEVDEGPSPRRRVRRPIRPRRPGGAPLGACRMPAGSGDGVSGAAYPLPRSAPPTTPSTAAGGPSAVGTIVRSTVDMFFRVIPVSVPTTPPPRVVWGRHHHRFPRHHHRRGADSSLAPRASAHRVHRRQRFERARERISARAATGQRTTPSRQNDQSRRQEGDVVASCQTRREPVPHEQEHHHREPMPASSTFTASLLAEVASIILRDGWARAADHRLLVNVRRDDFDGPERVRHAHHLPPCGCLMPHGLGTGEVGNAVQGLPSTTSTISVTGPATGSTPRRWPQSRQRTRPPTRRRSRRTRSAASPPRSIR